MKSVLRFFSPRLRFALPVMAGLLLLGPGCAVIQSHEEVRYSGRSVESSTLDRLQPGKTTEAWLRATLGEPSRVEDVGGKTRILSYDSTKIKKVDAKLLFVFDTSSHVELDQTVFIEFEDGVLVRYWKKSGHEQHS
ncbi:MAG: hypothetical protein J6386_07030 [Candidatus Synoicihabitans palmerolidicus]|nr:hypothetical protein [Candidatus Synoicihabitans palmerolidicus]